MTTDLEGEVGERLRRAAAAIEARTPPLHAADLLAGAGVGGRRGGELRGRGDRPRRVHGARALGAGLAVAGLLALALLVPLSPLHLLGGGHPPGGRAATKGTPGTGASSVPVPAEATTCSASWHAGTTSVGPGSFVVAPRDGLVVLSAMRDAPGSLPPEDGRPSWTLVGLGPGCAPDPAFGTGGVVSLSPPGSSRGTTGGVSGLTVAPGGGLFVLGYDARGWVVARLDADGRLDAGFGAGGYVVLDETGPPPQVSTPVPTSLAVAPSGEIFVAGTDGGTHASVEDRVVALRPDGSLVPSFGRGGTLLAGAGSWVPDVVVSGGALYVAEPSTDTGCSEVTVTGLTLAGSPLPGFSWAANEFGSGTSPSLSLPGVARGDAMTAAALPAADGGFLLAGMAVEGLCNSTRPLASLRRESSFLAGFGASGSPERSFGSGGSVSASGVFVGALVLASTVARTSSDGPTAVLASVPAGVGPFEIPWSSGPATLVLKAFTASGRPVPAAWAPGGAGTVLLGPSQLPPVLAAAPDGSLVIATFEPGDVTLVRVPAPTVDGQSG